MSLNLDKRQRAMLLEMGVRLWQPDAPLVALAPAGPDAAAPAEIGSARQAASAQAATPAARLSSREAIGPQAPPLLPTTPHRPPSAPVRHSTAQPVGQQSGAQPAGQSVDQSIAQPAGQSVRPSDGPSVGPPGVSRSLPEAPGSASAPAAWLLGQAQSLYADSVQSGGARWLVLAETPAAALDAPAFEGDAGRLLDNMLRAARLNRAGAVLLAPLVRQGAAATTPELAAALAALVAQSRPDIVLVMGRLASQALLPSERHFGKLRGHVHALHGVKTVVTHDAHYLLRAPDDKGKAWADLCLAMSLVAPSV